MNKDLERFIGQHRSEFDDEMPSEAAWENITSSLPVAVKRTHLYKWAAVAAMLCIVATTVYLVTGKKDTPPPVANAAGDANLVGQEYAAEMTKMYSLIEVQQTALRSLAAAQPALYKQFSEDLTALDSSYRLLKKQAMQAPGREPIIQAMLQNLQVQAALLSKQLQIIQEYNNTKKTNNEKAIYRPA